MGEANKEAAGNQIYWVYMTAGDPGEAERIGTDLIERRLAACVNIIPGMTSLYRWKGRVEKGTECVVIAKTCAAQWPAFEQAVQKIHSYECPCIVALPVVDGHPPFLRWIVDGDKGTV